MAKYLLFALFLFLAGRSYAQTPYSFNGQGSMSQELLNKYLDRAITVQGIGDVNTSAAERQQAQAMIRDVGAMFIGRVAGWWGSNAPEASFFASATQMVATIHQANPEIICQAGIYELTASQANNFTITTDDIRAVDLAFNRSSTQTTRAVIYDAMRYNLPYSNYRIYGQDMNEGQWSSTPDITKPETQYWFYHLATRYIDAGFEALHFGQVDIMNRADVGNVCWWTLLQRIREYARTHNRGLVLCDAHATPYYEPELYQSYRNGSFTLRDWQTYQADTSSPYKQLVLDFHANILIYQEATSCGGDGTNRVTMADDASLIRHRAGGHNPLGWYCYSNPFMLEFDNSDTDGAFVGCASRHQWWHVWGWDPVSWFAQQPAWYRTEVLSYTYGRIKCLDPNGHLEMLGRRNVLYGVPRSQAAVNYQMGGDDLYKCYDGPGAGEQSVIKGIWNGSISIAVSCTQPYASANAYLIRNRKTGQVMEMGGNLPAPTTAGTSANQWHSNGELKQVWDVTPVGNDMYKLVNRGSGYALEIGGGDWTALQQGSVADQWYYFAAANQHWKLSPVYDKTPGKYLITNVNSGQALTVLGGDPQDRYEGAKIGQGAVQQNTTTPQEEWELVPYSTAAAGNYPGVYTITNVNSGKLLEIPGLSTKPGEVATQYDNSGTDNQHWTITEAGVGAGIYNITNKYSGQRLEIGGDASASLANGATANQWPASTTLKQQWRIIDAGSGRYKLQCVNSQLLLEIGGSYMGNGAWANQWPDGGTNNQLWYIGQFGLNRMANPSTPLSNKVASDPVQENKLLLYPNPASTVLRLAVKDGGKVIAVAITDLRGATVASATAGNEQLDISTLSNGVYVITVKTEKQEYHQKFVKQ
jgi:hypothetical protein